jgi:tyrosyl-tRNA synthetase
MSLNRLRDMRSYLESVERGPAGSSAPPSFEVMPPRADADRSAFAAFLDGLAAQRPPFISVTCHRGQFAATLETAVAIQDHWGIPAMAHLPCRGLLPDELRAHVQAAVGAGIRAFLVLRGDGFGDPRQGAIVHAVEGIRIVREAAPDAFIAAACHPLGHPDDISSDDAMERLADKVSAGVDLLLAQFCFDPETFRSFHRRVREEGIAVPIRPGIMGIQRISQAVRAAERCGVPIEASAFDPAETEESLYPGLVRHHLRQYPAWGLPGAHVFTLNRPCWADAASTFLSPMPSEVETRAECFLRSGRETCVEIWGTGDGTGGEAGPSGPRYVARIVLTRTGRAILRIERPRRIEREIDTFVSVVRSRRGVNHLIPYAEGLKDPREHGQIRDQIPLEIAFALHLEAGGRRSLEIFRAGMLPARFSCFGGGGWTSLPLLGFFARILVFMPTPVTDPQVVEQFLSRAVENLYPSKDAFRAALLSGTRLTAYYGTDPTGPTLHLGHIITLKKLGALQKMGHRVVLLIGDFTAMIGDPTDKLAVRKQLTREEVLENSKRFKDQASKVLDFGGENPAELRFNSEWLAKMTFADVVELASNFTVQQMLERDMFETRIAEGKPVHLHEFLYPLMQGYDSVALDTDIEIGGNDQTFNMLAGRTLLKALKNKEKFVLTNALLVDATGKKMGKTEGNMLALIDTPEDMYGKVMSWTDGMILPGFHLCTDVPDAEIVEIERRMAAGENPIAFKRDLAHRITAWLSDAASAERAATHFASVHQKGEIPSDAPEFAVGAGMNIVEALVASKMCSSKSDARAQIEQGGVKIDGVAVSDIKATVVAGTVLQKGKRHFVKLV